MRAKWWRGWQLAAGDKREGSGVLDRSNMAGSHSYFSFTLLCIRIAHCVSKRYPVPQGSLPANGVHANFSNLSLPFRAQKALLRLMCSTLLLLSLHYCKHVRQSRQFRYPQCITHTPPRPHREASRMKNCPCLGLYTWRHGNRTT